MVAPLVRSVQPERRIIRYLSRLLCVCMLGLTPLIGCTETTGDGGTCGVHAGPCPNPQDLALLCAPEFLDDARRNTLLG